MDIPAIRPLHAVVIANDAATVATIRDALEQSALERSGDDVVTITWARSLAAGVARLGDRGIDVVLLDPELPDSEGIDSFDECLLAARGTPIVVVTARDGEAVARLATLRGAKDRLLKEHIDRCTLRSVLRQVIERAVLDDALRVQRERAEAVLDSIGDALVSVDNDGEVTYLNPAAERLTGWSRDQAIGRALSDVFRIIDGDTREPAPIQLDAATRRARAASLPANSVLVMRDGNEFAIDEFTTVIRDREGQGIGTIIVFRDASETRIREQKLSRWTQHDVLTDLPNRTLLEDRLDQAIALARRHGNQVAVLCVDLDFRRHVNDSMGHEIDDALLREIGKRLVATVRRSDTVSRQDRDKFVIVLSEVDHPQNAARHAERIHAVLSAPYGSAPDDLRVEAGIGISMFPDDGQDAGTLIKCADTAMYHARQSGHNMYRLFKPDMYARLFEQQLLKGHLQRALDRGEFVLHYQPTTNLGTGTMTGVEALIRWLHPQRGLLGPTQFVPVAEECGLIAPIGKWVLGEACRQARAWQQSGLRPMVVSVNVSALEFRHRGLLPAVRSALAISRLDPRYLALEVREHVLMQDVEFAVMMLRVLESMGVGVTIDDFGRGHSDQSELRRFVGATLKIDPTLVRGGTSNPGDAAIVSAVINLGGSLRRRVVAKGVETRAQVTALRSRRCDEGQGFHLGRPMPAEELASLLAVPTLVTIGIGRESRVQHSVIPRLQRAPSAQSMR